MSTAIVKQFLKINIIAFEANYFGKKQQQNKKIENTNNQSKFHNSSNENNIHRFTKHDLGLMGLNLAVSVLDFSCPYFEGSRLNCGRKHSDVREWAVAKLRNMYRKAQVPLEEEVIQALFPKRIKNKI